MFSPMNFTGFLNVNQQTNLETKYEVLEVIGEGGYGTVTKCRDRVTGELVALKRIRDDGPFSRNFHKELEMLKYIKRLDPDSYNLVKLVDFYDYHGCESLAFEMLDMSVGDLLQKMRSLTLSQIRPMAKQLLTALYGLQCVGVIHTDIKPDNIMLVNHKEKPFKVKLIDFGLAKHSGQVPTGKMMQPIAYRAPEVTLGLPLWEAVDMWGLACCLLISFVRSSDFVALSEFDFLNKIVHFLGVPSEKLLNTAMYTSRYFVQENSKWRLKTLQEFRETTGRDPEMPLFKPLAANLEQLIKGSGRFVSDQEERDMEQFHDLLCKMLKLDAEERIRPSEALDHPFITMAHLPEGDDYTKKAHELMRITEAEFVPPQQDNIVFMASHPNIFGFGNGTNTYLPIPKPPGEISIYKTKETVEMPKMEMDLRFPNPVSYSSDDNIFFMASHPTFFGFGNGSDTYLPMPKSPGEILVRIYNKMVEMPKMKSISRSPGEISVCGFENFTNDLHANGDTWNPVYSPNACSLSPGEIEVDASDLPNEGKSVNEEFIHNRERKSQFEKEECSGSKSLATQNSQLASRIEGEDTVEKPKDALTTEAGTILERLKEELPDCGEILEDIEKLFQDGEATEAEISQLSQRASRSFFGRLIPRRLRVLFSRLFKSRKTSTSRPIFRKPKWVQRIAAFTRGSTTSGPSNH